MPVFIRSVRAALLAAFVLGAAPALAQTPASATTLPPISAFFANAAFGGAKLSPDASHLAARSSAKGQRDFLVVVDLQSNSGKIVATYTDADVGEFEWVNNDRLVFNTRDKSVGQGNARTAPGLYAVNRDGGQFAQLAERTGGGLVAGGHKSARKLLPWNTFLTGQKGAQDSNTIYVIHPVSDTRGETRYVDLLRVDTVTGFSQPVPRPGNARGWMLDHKGEPRVASTIDQGNVTLHYREPASGEWRVLTSYKAYGDGSNAIEPVGFGPDGTFYVAARNGKDTTALHTFDIAAGKLNPEPLLVAPGYDFAGGLVTNRAAVLGIAFTTDATSNEWFDPGMKQVQEKLDKLLPATINLVSVPAQADSPWVLVTSYSDVYPSSFALYNKSTGVLNKVGDARPGLNPAQMGRQQFVRYKARDGLDIPALLTLPPGKGHKNLPMVMLVHGGPYVRGVSWGWGPESQFLASRGYAVLEPDFRGSTGYGAKHFKAGWKQWGLSMQDDLADGVQWMVKQGTVDPQRVCIAGASYGGYATLMGLVNDPALYKCGINWVGVTDIGLLFDNGWSFTSDMSEEYKVYGMPELIGDPVKEAERFKATSPIQQAARITQPLLLAYGGVDYRVPINHGTAFRSAVMRTNKNVEWVEYPDEGHGWGLEKNRIDFYTRVEKFLDQHIGSGAAR